MILTIFQTPKHTLDHLSSQLYVTTCKSKGEKFTKRNFERKYRKVFHATMYFNILEVDLWSNRGKILAPYSWNEGLQSKLLDFFWSCLRSDYSVDGWLPLIGDNFLFIIFSGCHLFKDLIIVFIHTLKFLGFCFQVNYFLSGATWGLPKWSLT